MYFESQVQPRENRGMSLDHLEADDIRHFFREALDWSTLCCPANWPLPPAGLPGKLHNTYDRYSDEAALIRIGMGYIIAAIRKESRGMHNRWQEAETFLRERDQAIREFERNGEVQKHVERLWLPSGPAAPQDVYFIGSENGPIKIGISANPRARLGNLQTGHHDRLDLLATCEGGMDREKKYHQQFAAHRINGEWFERTPEIEAEINRLNQEPTA
jgi:hypothetical protein